MAGHTPNLGFWYPDGTDPISAGDDGIRELTARLDEVIPAIPPAGTIAMFAASNAPIGWIACNGQAIDRVVYADLFAVISTTYGVGDGTTTFNVPNMQGRFPVGVDTANTDFDAINKQGGSSTHDHNLGSAGFAEIVVTASAPQLIMRRIAAAAWTATHAISGIPSAAGSTAAQSLGAELGGKTNPGNGLPPYLALRFIIKT